MITQNRIGTEFITDTPKWQKEMSESFRSVSSLLNYLNITPSASADDERARRLFPMIVPKPFADLMEPGNRNDPLLLQVLPNAREFEQAVGFVNDPLSEQTALVLGDDAPVIRKYRNRALLLVRSGCAVNCRYCFRRAFPYPQKSANKALWLETLAQLAGDQDINELILSGGDPLMADDQWLIWLFQQIDGMNNISRIRIHSRLPVVLPSRLEHFERVISATSKPVIFVLHINHPQEISDGLRAAVTRLQPFGVRWFNQAVLLKAVNDDAHVLMTLHETLFDAGIQPYYLHCLDKVQGAAHFDVPVASAVAIMQQVLRQQSGYLIPKLVRELPGEASKTPIPLL